MPRTPKRDATSGSRSAGNSSNNNASVNSQTSPIAASTSTKLETESTEALKGQSSREASVDPEQRTVVFFHPDLGIGGAERLVVDAAVGLQAQGRRVVIFTSYCDQGHCFEEARDGSLDVRIRGNVLPPTLFGRFKILLTILRHYHLLLSITLSGELSRLHPEAFFADQLSAGLPLLRFLYPTVRILFYCHFPDLLLVQRRSAWIKRLWRLPFDALEGWSMRGADRVVVNSEFTKGVVHSVWPGLGGNNGLGVVYPCVDTDVGTRELIRGFPRLWGGRKVVLSINRFERKKDVALAIRAFAQISRSARDGAKLIIAGGYDDRERENVSYHEELVALAEKHGLTHATAKNAMTAGGDAQVLYLLSVSSQMKEMLLKTATLLLYTPTNEHFGIVPLEAMLAGVPVLATNSGGPLETVDEGVTGWRRDPDDVDAWSQLIEHVLTAMPAAELERMGAAGRDRVMGRFSQTAMASTLNDEIRRMQRRARVSTLELRDILLALAMFGALVAGAVAMLMTKIWRIR